VSERSDVNTELSRKIDNFNRIATDSNGRSEIVEKRALATVLPISSELEFIAGILGAFCRISGEVSLEALNQAVLAFNPITSFSNSYTECCPSQA